MTREEFIEILDREKYSYKIVNNKIIITSKSKWGIHLVGSWIDDLHIVIIEEIPSGIIFQGKGDVNLSSLELLPPDIEFRNTGNIDLSSLKVSIDMVDVFNNKGSITFSNLYWRGNWVGNIDGIDNKRLLNLMIKQGVFI